MFPGTSLRSTGKAGWVPTSDSRLPYLWQGQKRGTFSTLGTGQQHTRKGKCHFADKNNNSPASSSIFRRGESEVWQKHLALIDKKQQLTKSTMDLSCPTGRGMAVGRG